MITVHGGGEISRTSSDVHDPLPIHALNGKVERSHRIDAEEIYRMLDGFVIDDTGVFNDKLREWELLQLPSPPRRPRRPDSLRTPQAEDPDPGVSKLRQMHT
jgi:hypothetical protein